VITELERSSAERIGDGPRLYLVHNDPLEELLFDRNLMGTEGPPPSPRTPTAGMAVLAYLKTDRPALPGGAPPTAPGGAGRDHGNGGPALGGLRTACDKPERA
jgi:hypothetical protein